MHEGFARVRCTSPDCRHEVLLEQKITYIEDTGKVIHRPGMTHGSNKRDFEVDPLGRSRCGYEMKIISLIHEPDVIARILRHSGLWKQCPAAPARRFKAPEGGPVVMEGFDGRPGYEGPVLITR